MDKEDQKFAFYREAAIVLWFEDGAWSYAVHQHELQDSGYVTWQAARANAMVAIDALVEVSDEGA